MKILLNIIFGVAAIVAAWTGAIDGNPYGANLILFWAFVHAVCSLLVFCLSKEKAKEIAAKIESPQWLSHALDIPCMVILVAAGWFWCAAALFFAIVSTSWLYDQRPKP